MVQNKNISKQSGFTMIEILFVLSIVGIILTIGLTSYSKVLKSSRDSTRKTDLESISSALEQFKNNNEYASYPESIYDNPNFEKYMTSVPTPYPTGYNPIPTDPQTKKDYIYIPLPAECLPSIEKPCTSYNLTTTLENGSEEFTINQYGKQ